MRFVLGWLVMGSLCLVLFTGWALEGGGVGVIETRRVDGGVRSTHVWFVELDGETWLEAGTPENGWYVDVQHEPIVTFSGGDRSGRFVAQTIAGRAAHRRIRSLLREKYGIRDWWIGVLFDTTRSIAVRLMAEDAHAASSGSRDGGISQHRPPARRDAGGRSL